MFLPYDLRDAIEARVGVKPEQLHGRDHGVELRTSTNVGRMTLVLLGLALTALLWMGVRKGPASERRTTIGVGLFLGILALAIDLVVLACSLFWVRETWIVLVLWPTDVALGFLKPELRKRYVTLRLVVLALFGVLSLVHLIAQPLVAIVLLAALPLGFMLRRLRAAQI